MTALLFPKALTPEGWREGVRVETDRQGMIRKLESGCPQASASTTRGLAIPGVPNAHSHAHQRLLAGLAEAGSQSGDFMRWRQLMYQVAGRIDPDSFEAVAALAYMEMLKSGYTSVAEFHYLHHDVDGLRYSRPEEMGLRCIAAAEQSGIALTLLPGLYCHGGFGPQPALPEQARFVCGPATYLEIYAALDQAADGLPDVRLGCAPHSLRAVDGARMREAVAAVHAIDAGAPVHIHVAEQRAEAEACQDWCGATPVRRLLDQADVDTRWNVIHATHMDDSERCALARSGAAVTVCPSTEANLGDGVFAARQWLALGGALAIGSDSQVTISPADEMRLVEYAQRLTAGSRNVLAAGCGRSPGAMLLDSVLKAGAQALAQPCGALAEGLRADIVVLDEDHPALIARRGGQALDSWIFCGGAACVRDVFVGGRQVVRQGRHVNEAAIVSRYRNAAERLLQ